MEENKNTLPLEMEIENLRQKLKSSNRETVEECERLRAEIQRLYFQLARITRPGRYAEKRRKIKSYGQENKTITPEVIPPDLDVNEYLNHKEEAAAARDNNQYNQASDDSCVTVPPGEKTGINTSDSCNALVPVIPEPVVHLRNNISAKCKSIPRSLRERDATIEERFAMVAERMQERRHQWLENQEKKRPWWRRHPR